MMLLWVGVLPLSAGKAEKQKSGEADRLSPEREAQFYYDFYAAQKAMNDGQYARAFCLFRLCEQINPTDGRTQDYLGMIYDALHQKDSAYAFFSRAYAYAPGDLYQHYAGVLMEQRRFKEAFAIIQSAAKVHPDDADVWHMLLQAAIAKSDYHTAGKAIDKIDQLLGPSPYSALVRYQIAIRKQNIKQAFVHLDEYLEMDPNNPTVLNDYAYLLATHKGDLNKAEQMSSQAIQLQPNNPSFLDTYGWILHLKGQNSLAQFYLNKALNLTNDNNEKTLILQHLEKTK